jgi:hypothetical protein
MPIMKKMLASAVALAAIAAASQAQAVTILNAVNLTQHDLVAGDNLANNSFAGKAYLFYEGTANGVASYLLHYDRRLFRDPIAAVGSFQLGLAANETLLDVITTWSGLNASDPSNGVTYPTGALSFRGLESLTLGGFQIGDWVSTSGSNPIDVNFKFATSSFTRDQARFLIGVSAVPEPTTWAMMILGLGMAGAAMRRRQRQTVNYNFA